MSSAELVAKEKKPKTRKPDKVVGVRELSKQESQHKIMVAARELFAELGYDRATLRQIAAKAGLTVGALFNHVTDKRDLIYLIFNEEVSTVVDLALTAPRPYQNFSAKLRSIAEHYYRLFASEPVLSRILLSEVVVISPGMHLDRYILLRNKLLNGYVELVTQGQQTGELKSYESPEVVSRYIFFVFAASIRWWLASSPRPEWRDGMRDFDRMMRLVTDGLVADPSAEDKSS
jgi:AcrR family transcriptional regulator